MAAVNRNLKDIHIEKQNNTFRGGTFDVWYSPKGGCDLWVEYKWIARIPKKAPVNIPLSPLQVMWGKQRYAEGRNVAVCVGCADGGIVLPGIAWDTPVPVDEFVERIEGTKAIAMRLRALMMEPRCSFFSPVLSGT